ncbi:MAG: restriction endonuclease subunit S [Patescibacteria group bacterium]
MVEAQTKNQNAFWLWNDRVDWILRGDVRYWIPQFIEAEKQIKPFLFFNEFVKKISSGENLRQQEGDYIFFRTQNLYDILPDLSEVSFTNTRGDLIQEGDLLFGRVGKIGTSCVYIGDNKKEATYSDNILKVEIDKDKINPFFVSVFLASKFGQVQFQRQQKGTNQPLLDTEILRRLKILVATRNNQQKVEQIVKDAFRLKQEAEKEYQEAVEVFLKSIKTYISEWDTLTSETTKAFWLWSDQVDIASRIDPDYYSGEGMRNKLGKTKSLGELAEIKIGKTPAFDDYLPSGERRIMKFRAITGRGIDLENEERGFIKEEFFQKNKQNKLNKDDIVLGSAAHQAHYIGKYLDIVDELPKEFADGVLTVAEIMTIRAKEAINPFVLLLFLRSGLGYELIQRQIKGQTSHLYPKDVGGIGIPEAITKISKSEAGKAIESNVRSSLEKSRLSRQKLQEAKKVVENLIVK